MCVSRTYDNVIHSKMYRTLSILFGIAKNINCTQSPFSPLRLDIAGLCDSEPCMGVSTHVRVNDK